MKLRGRVIGPRAVALAGEDRHEPAVKFHAHQETPFDVAASTRYRNPRLFGFRMRAIFSFLNAHLSATRTAFCGPTSSSSMAWADRQSFSFVSQAMTASTIGK